MFEKLNVAQHIRSIDDCKGYRVVEDQQFITTRSLVDSTEEHDILEAMLEANKPPKPSKFKMSDAAASDYLLFTPFRYPPLKEGTRFGSETEPSLFYGCQSLEGVFAEVAYHRFKFILDTEAEIPAIIVNYTSFVFKATSNAFVDLTQLPFLRYKRKLVDKKDYAYSQKLGRVLRSSDVDMFYFFSARCNNSVNIAIFSPSVFTEKTSNHIQWQCFTNDNYIEFVKDRKTVYGFPSR